MAPIDPHSPTLRMEEEHDHQEPRMEVTELRDKEDSTGPDKDKDSMGMDITLRPEAPTAGMEDSLRARGDLTDTTLHKVMFPPE